jgi:hypothetical protein
MEGHFSCLWPPQHAAYARFVRRHGRPQMTPTSRNVLIITACGVVFAATVAVSLFFELDRMVGCGDRELNRQPSPDAQHVVIVFERDCGATTDFSTQVSVLPVGTQLSNKAGNVLMIDRNGEAAPRGPGGGPEVQFKWLGSDSLVVSYDRHARVFYQSRAVGNIVVLFSLLDRHGA